MNKWILGRMSYCEEQPGNGGEGGGGGGGEPSGDKNARPSAVSLTLGCAPAGGEGGGSGGNEPSGEGAASPLGGEGGELNALGETLKPKGGGGGGAGNEPSGEGAEKQKCDKPSGEGAASPEGAPTEEEVKAYGEALKLDEGIFGKGMDFDKGFRERLPAFFKKYGIEPEKANAMANDFTRMQKEVDEQNPLGALSIRKYKGELIDKGNKYFHETYDKQGQEAIGRAFNKYFHENSPMRNLLISEPIGVDKELLQLLHDVGQTIPKEGAPGAASGAGVGGKGKSISDSFMGV